MPAAFEAEYVFGENRTVVSGACLTQLFAIHIRVRDARIAESVVAVGRKIVFLPLPERRVGVIEHGADRERVAAAPMIDETHVQTGEAELLVLQRRGRRRIAAILRTRRL